MSELKQGGYVKDEYNNSAKILAECGVLFAMSSIWRDPNHREKSETGMSGWFTKEALASMGYFPCTPQEAGVPEERWIPEYGTNYHAAHISVKGIITTNIGMWASEQFDRDLLAIGNVHKTSEEAINWAKKKYNIV